jgi:hypothetical protein
MKRFYLVMVVLGSVIPWLFFGQFFLAEGLNLLLFIEKLFANAPSSGAMGDLVISALVFWAWSYQDSRARGVPHWWVLPIATLLIGVSCALPLYLYLREDTQPSLK